MKYLKIFYLFPLLFSINCFSQEIDKFEHWDDRYNKKDLKEIQKSQDFMNVNNLKTLEIYSFKNGVKGRFIDSLPYIFIKSADTITYLIPGGLFPQTREDFLENTLHNVNQRPYYIEAVRNDGRIGVNVLREYKFLIEKNKLYYIYQTSTMDREKEMKLYDRLFETDSETEKGKIYNEIAKYLYYEKQLIFDFEKQNKIGEKIIIDSKRYSQLLETFLENGVEYYKIRTNITLFNLIDREFIIDRNCNFYLIERHEIKN